MRLWPISEESKAMTAHLRGSRELIARNRLEDFEFRARVCQAGAWSEEVTDAVSCPVFVGAGKSRDAVTFRVVFWPASIRVRDIEVEERLTA
jgi:hypothetical protein